MEEENKYYSDDSYFFSLRNRDAAHSDIVSEKIQLLLLSNFENFIGCGYDHGCYLWCYLNVWLIHVFVLYTLYSRLRNKLFRNSHLPNLQSQGTGLFSRLKKKGPVCTSWYVTINFTPLVLYHLSFLQVLWFFKFIYYFSNIYICPLWVRMSQTGNHWFTSTFHFFVFALNTLSQRSPTFPHSGTNWVNNKRARATLKKRINTAAIRIVILIY